MNKDIFFEAIPIINIQNSISNETIVVKAKQAITGEPFVTFIEFIGSDDYEDFSSLLHKSRFYIEKFFDENYDNEFKDCDHMDIVFVKTYPDENIENCAYSADCKVTLDTHSILCHVIQMNLGNPIKALSKKIGIWSTLLRYDVSEIQRRNILENIYDIHMDEEQFQKFLELSKVLYLLEYDQEELQRYLKETNSSNKVELTQEDNSKLEKTDQF